MTEELTPDQRSALRYALGKLDPYVPTRRDYFAAAALTGLMASGVRREHLPQEAVRLAYATIAALDAKEA